MNKHLSFGLAGLLVAGLAAPGLAALKNPMEVGLQLGYLLIEGDSDVDNDFLYGARAATYLREDVAAELSVMAGQFDLKTGNREADILLPTIEFQKYFRRSGKWRPYIAGGAGYLQINRERTVEENKIDFAVLYGAGVKFHFLPSFLARLDGRHIIDSESGEGTNNALISLGVSWLYGSGEKPAPVAVKAVDSDGDGVPDSGDSCPDTPLGMTVDAQGCPPPPPAPEPAPEVKAVPPPVVPKDEWVLKGVRFESGLSKITPDSRPALQEAVEILRAHPEVRIQIQGHTDRTGTALINQNLSEARALAIQEYLVDSGISPDRLETKGFGFTKPIADNKTAEGRAKNRRIEFRVLNPQTPQVP